MISYRSISLLVVPVLVWFGSTAQAADGVVRDPIDLLTEKNIQAFLDGEATGDDNVRNLQEVVGYGDKCNDRKVCQAPLECTETSQVASRCLPVTCINEQLAANPIDMGVIKTTVFAQAGTSEEELQAALASAPSLDRSAVFETDLFQAVIDSFVDNEGAFDSVQAAFDACVPPPPEGDGRRLQSNATRVNYLGIHAECSLGLDGVYSYISAQIPGTNDRLTYNRGCIGTELGFGGDINLLYGIAFTSLPGDISTCGFFIDIDVGALLAGGIAYGIGFNAVSFLEFTGGAGFGLGALGCNFCGTF